MSQDAMICLGLIAIIWLGWPLHSIASDFRELLKLAKKQ